MRGDRRRGWGLWRMVVDDPYRKLVAIGLAILMWFFIGSRINKTIERQVPLLVVGDTQTAATAQVSSGLAVVLPTERVAPVRFLDGEREIKYINVRLSGPRFRIDAIEEEALNLSITTFLSREWGRSASGGRGKEDTIEFTAANIRPLRTLQGIRIELVPTRVRLEVKLRDNLTVPLPGVDGEFVDLVAEGGIGDRLRRETAVYTPEEARLLGSADQIEKLTQRGPPFFRAVLKASGNERQVRAELDIIGGDTLDVYFETKPKVVIELFPETSTFTVRLPIVVDDLSLPPEQRDRFEPERDAVDVRVRVAGNLRTRLLLLSVDSESNRLQEWAESTLRLEAYIPRPDPGVIYGDEMRRQAYLVPVGTPAAQAALSECLLDETVTVNLLRKQ